MDLPDQDSPASWSEVCSLYMGCMHGYYSCFSFASLPAGVPPFSREGHFIPYLVLSMLGICAASRWRNHHRFFTPKKCACLFWQWWQEILGMLLVPWESAQGRGKYDMAGVFPFCTGVLSANSIVCHTTLLKIHSIYGILGMVLAERCRPHGASVWLDFSTSLTTPWMCILLNALRETSWAILAPQIECIECFTWIYEQMAWVATAIPATFDSISSKAFMAHGQEMSD